MNSSIIKKIGVEGLRDSLSHIPPAEFDRIDYFANLATLSELDKQIVGEDRQRWTIANRMIKTCYKPDIRSWLKGLPEPLRADMARRLNAVVKNKESRQCRKK